MKPLGFIDDFRTPNCARLALQLIMDKQVDGLTYRQILEYPGFCDLFTPEFINGKSQSQLEIKLKNMVRDLRDYKATIPTDWEPVQAFFRSRKRGLVPRKSKVIEKSTPVCSPLSLNKDSIENLTSKCFM